MLQRVLESMFDIKTNDLLLISSPLAFQGMLIDKRPSLNTDGMILCFHINFTKLSLM